MLRAHSSGERTHKNAAHDRWGPSLTRKCWPVMALWTRWRVVCASVRACCACEPSRKTPVTFFPHTIWRHILIMRSLSSTCERSSLSVELMHLFLLLLPQGRHIFSSQAPHRVQTREWSQSPYSNFLRLDAPSAGVWSRPDPARLFSKIMWETMRQSAASKFLLSPRFSW